MQIVRPIDVEEALSAEVADALDGVTASGPPAPPDLMPPHVCVTSVGGGPQGPVAHEHDVSIDVWAETPAMAMALANEVCGVVAALPLRNAGHAAWTTSDPMLPYPNPDPSRPRTPRYTLRATVGARGVPIEL